MGFWRGRGKEPPEKPAPVQLRPADRHPFSLIDGYVPLHQPEFSLYRAIREAVPVVDAAVLKLVRLAGGVGVTCQDKEAERALNHFLRTVPVGWNQKGIQAFLDSYLDCLLTCGRAVGEIVPSRDGRDIAAVLCGRVSDVQVKEGDSPLEVLLALRRPDGRTEVLPRQELLLFTPYHPSPEHPYGVSLLHSLPFLSGVLLKIYQTLGANWERAGNVRFAVVYKPGEEALDHPVRGCAGLCGGGGCGDQGHWRGVRHPRLPGTGADDSGAADRPDGDSSLPAGAELVLHRADEQPAGGHYDQ